MNLILAQALNNLSSNTRFVIFKFEKALFTFSFDKNQTQSFKHWLLSFVIYFTLLL